MCRIGCTHGLVKEIDHHDVNAIRLRVVEGVVHVEHNRRGLCCVAPRGGLAGADLNRRAQGPRQVPKGHILMRETVLGGRGSRLACTRLNLGSVHFLLSKANVGKHPLSLQHQRIRLQFRFEKTYVMRVSTHARPRAPLIQGG